MLLPGFARLAASPEFTISSPAQNDRKCFGGCLHGSPRRFSKCEDHRCTIAHKSFRKRRKPIEVALGETHVDAYVLAIDEPILRERPTQLMEPGIAGQVLAV